MSGTRGVSQFVATFLNNVVKSFGYKKKQSPPCTAPCDGFILKSHYQYTFWLLFAGFCFTWYSWFHDNVISCVSHYNADQPVKSDLVNICLSYPYVYGLRGEVLQLMMYRWLHFVFLLLAMFYYLPRKLSKCIENPKLKKLVEDLSHNFARSDNIERELVQRGAKFFAIFRYSHNSMYYKYILVNLACLAIDISSWQILDFVFNGKFAALGYMSMPFDRDPEHFTDNLSRAFPPFARCSITRTNRIIGQRNEEIGCHLLYMELYEKFFVLLWAWLAFQTAATVCYIIYICMFTLPYFRPYLFRISGPPHILSEYTNDVSETIEAAICHCKVGDIFVLYRLKKNLSVCRFYDLLRIIGDLDTLEIMEDRAVPRDYRARETDDENNDHTINMNAKNLRMN